MAKEMLERWKCVELLLMEESGEDCCGKIWDAKICARGVGIGGIGHGEATMAVAPPLPCPKRCIRGCSGGVAWLIRGAHSQTLGIKGMGFQGLPWSW